MWDMYLFASMGIVFVIYGILKIKKSGAQYKGWIKADGIIDEVKEDPSSAQGQKRYFLHVTYTREDGKTRHAEFSGRGVKGGKVTILYDPQSENDDVLNTFESMHGGISVFLAIGVAFILYSLLRTTGWHPQHCVNRISSFF